MLLERNEFKYILLCVVFALFWFLWLLPKVVKTVQGPMQFLILNLGFVFVVFFVFKACSIGGRLGLKEIIGGMIFAMAFSIWSVPLMVGFNGELFTGATAYTAAADYNATLLWMSMGISGNMLYIFTYVATPIILLILGSSLIKNSVRRF